MRFTQDAQVIPSIGREISAGCGFSVVAAFILHGSIPSGSCGTGRRRLA